MSFPRITIDPGQMDGTPCSEADILRHYPDLEATDIREALRYASEAECDHGLPRQRDS